MRHTRLRTLLPTGANTTVAEFHASGADYREITLWDVKISRQTDEEKSTTHLHSKEQGMCIPALDTKHILQ